MERRSGNRPFARAGPADVRVSAPDATPVRRIMGVFAPPAARVLMSMVFILAGVSKVSDWPGTAASMRSNGMVAVPFFLAVAVAVEIGAGVALLVGFRTRLAAIALFLFLVPTTIIFHDFWIFEGAERETQRIDFLKNLAIMGGLLLVAAFGPGSSSVDGKEGARRVDGSSSGKPSRRHDLRQAGRPARGSEGRVPGEDNDDSSRAWKDRFEEGADPSDASDLPRKLE